jgi:mono/diheme cytochrome c family protein
MNSTICAILWATLAAAPPQVEPAHSKNAVYLDVLSRGVKSDGTGVSLPEPQLRDGLDAAAQRAALRELAGSDQALEERLRDSVTAPYTIRVCDAKASADVIRVVDLWFVVHADIARVDPLQEAARSDGKEVEAGNMAFRNRLLKADDLRAARISPAGEVPGINTWYAHIQGRLLDRIAFDVTNEVVASRSSESLVIAARTALAFGKGGPNGNSWSAITSPGGPKVESAVHPYAGGCSYAKISRLIFKPGALLVEMHAAFVEPHAWFQGAPILRSKFSVIAQDQIRSLRRELAKKRQVSLRLGAAAAARQAGAILASQCVSCHGPEKKKGGLDLTLRERALAGGHSGAGIVPGEPGESLLVEKITEGEMPPTGALSADQVATVRAWVEAGAPYPVERLVARRAGADWWSLQPVRHPSPPEFRGSDAAWLRTPVDAFVLAGLKAAGLQPAPPADRATLIRRVTFDLTGLPPTPAEVEAFLGNPDPCAYDALVDRLLASPHYGERWGRHWLDVVRFGESQGYETNLPRPTAWPYRDYVIHSFNRDTPFRQFVFEQIAGDTLSPGRDTADWLTASATGFLVGGAHDIVGNQTVEGTLQQRADDLDDMITVTGTTFLGLTVQCARCHDHKFDPIRQTDYYGLQAIFAGITHAEREILAPDVHRRRLETAALAAELSRVEQRLDSFEPVARPESDVAARLKVNPRRNVERFAATKARVLRFTILATADGTEPCVDEIEVFTAATRDHAAPSKRETAVPSNIALASAGGTVTASSEYPGNPIHKIAHLNDGHYGNGRSWISRVRGRGVITINWPEPAVIDRVVWGRDREGVYRDRLASHYYLEVGLEPDRLQVVASSLDRAALQSDAGSGESPAVSGLLSGAMPERAELLARRAMLTERLAQQRPTIKVYAGTFSQPGPTHLLIRGDPTNKGPKVRPAGIAALNPALVIVSGAPEADRRAALARWIADPASPLPARVMVNRVWHYHFGRGIVATPGDFGFNGSPPSHPELLDWLARAYTSAGGCLKPIHRLILGSSTYQQSSRLDSHAQAVDRDNRLLWRVAPRRLEAEAIRDAILAASGQLDTHMGGPGYNIWEKNTNYVAVYKPRAELGPGDFRRMVYQFKPRSQPDPTFGAFDCPDAALVAPRRNISTTALQALNLFNSPFVVRQSELFAERLLSEAGSDSTSQAERGFRLAFGRSPSPSERNAAVKLIGSHGTAAFCRALYNANEFVYVP